MKSLPKRIEGFAIVSEDGMLADASGVMPDSLKFEADQVYFAEGLDRLDAVVHGRHSHEMQPHSALRYRLTITGAVPALARDPADPKGWLWNPAGASFEEAWAALNLPNGTLGVVGGTTVFGMFLSRYDLFHLTRAPGLRLPSGRPVFPGVPEKTPEQILTAAGLVPSERRVLDAAHDLTVTVWRRKAPVREE
jgi:hypothetical protein